MNHYNEQKFNIPELKGISRKTTDEHLKLYAGYVKNVNAIHDKIAEYMQDSEKNALALAELQRRFSFEWNGMRNHEHFFASFEGGTKEISEKSGGLKEVLANEFGSFENWLATFKSVALMRGVGWAMLYWDKKTSRPVHAWVEEQHLGQLNGLNLILGLDMWEHSYYLDYTPSEKKKYIEAFFENLNWEVIETEFEKNK